MSKHEDRNKASPKLGNVKHHDPLDPQTFFMIESKRYLDKGIHKSTGTYLKVKGFKIFC